jgi:hypothetical protein
MILVVPANERQTHHPIIPKLVRLDGQVQWPHSMRAFSGLCLPLLLVLCGFARLSSAQEPPPRIGPFVVDLHGTVPRFPNDPQLAESRGLAPGELPGSGLGVHTGAHVYVLEWRALTVGLGGSLTLARSHSGVKPLSPVETGRAVTEKFTHVAPELSFNFGTGRGWSYISGGIGPGVWSVVPDGQVPTPGDEERLQTINYGGGARWFAKPHLAFSFDVRFYAINPGSPRGLLPGSPRRTLLILGAGVSVK